MSEGERLQHAGKYTDAAISLLFFYHPVGCFLKGNFVHLSELVRVRL